MDTTHENILKNHVRYINDILPADRKVKMEVTDSFVKVSQPKGASFRFDWKPENVSPGYDQVDEACFQILKMIFLHAFVPLILRDINMPRAKGIV